MLDDFSLVSDFLVSIIDFFCFFIIYLTHFYHLLHMFKSLFIKFF